LHLGQGVGFPAGATLAEEALEKLVCRFVVAAFLAGEFSISGNQATLADSLQHRGAIPLEMACTRFSAAVAASSRGIACRSRQLFDLVL
jgi:hypothetical protein